MKRYATLFLSALVLFSCKKADHTVATNKAEYSEVPNWLNVAMVANMPGGGTDTVFGYIQNDFSYISYKGIPYRVRAQKGLKDYMVADTGRKFYVTVFDGYGNALMDCFVNPGRYTHENHLVPQPQAFRPILVAPFVNDRKGDYVSR